MSKKLIFSFALVAFVMYSCSNNGGQETNNNANSNKPVKVGGGRYYGGTLRINEPEYFKNIYPHSIVSGISNRIASQVYDGLFKFNQSNLDVTENLCESYTVSEDQLTYTFKIRKGVMFHDNSCFEGGKGRELTTEDIKYCFQLLCTQYKENKGFFIFDGVVKGAKEYYEASAGNKTPDFDLEGLEIVDPYTFKITLVSPSSLFTYDLARPFTFIFPKEARKAYGAHMRSKAVGTGPFILADVDENVSVNLKRNPNYFGKDKFDNPLPFLDGINIRFIKDKKQELFAFKKGDLDMIYRLPTEHIIDIMEANHNEGGDFSKYQIQRNAEMSTNMLGFQMNDPLFQDVNVRKAFSFAIDREKILDYVLNGEGFEGGYYGITPPTFKKYDVKKIKGYRLNIDSAKYYLDKAGYPNGKGFPARNLDVNPGAERNINVAIEVKKQLKDNLNIDIDINSVPIATHVENLEKGKSGFFRIAWRADVPLSQNFLSMLYGKDVPETMDEESYPNVMRYKNEKFDELYEKGLRSSNIEEANQYFLQAEQVAMNDAPFIVVWYDEGFRLLQPNVRNFPNNAMQYRDFSEVYVEPNKAKKPAENKGDNK